ncbi:M42 family metallopeptidase [Anaeromicrobium sediminis]|uniref:Aminopeptidase n=1 Tax=Anaeromicrobium sediminis TaxID=1478221 RepID=A0A267MN72_9FIRM|nr:M42 family metallopeptidase [Anaeromicrobium sediminis]PAB60200.1 aminopeptidase [Anaeromicrobium sediminis]
MLLEKLTSLNGVSGNEDAVRNFIKEEIKDHVDEIKIDRLGNLIAIKHGKENYPKVMLSAHMDEVGLMVKSINDKGFVKFLKVGGIDDKVLVSKPVSIGDKKITGVIGAKAIHLQTPKERTVPLKSKDLYIDIGAKSKDDGKKHVSPGDYICFLSDYVEFGDDLIKAKALDDRAGCAIIMDLLKNNYDSTIYAVFSVQEEVGLRGAAPYSYRLDSDLAIVIETTSCFDLDKVEEPDFVTKMHGGPAFSVLDRVTYYSKAVTNRLIGVAKDNNISYQFKQVPKGGNDSGQIHLSKNGIPTACISMPCRYLHSPVSVISKRDFNNSKKLLDEFLKDIKKEEFVNV